MIVILNIILSLLQLLVLFGLCYHYALLIASALKHNAAQPPASTQRRFAIAIPAHNESAVLAQTLDQLKRQNYPTDLVGTYVAADHCQDNTAQIAREHGAVCYERNIEPHGRKVYPVQWLLEKILDTTIPYDAIVIFDADSHVDPQFLPTMNEALEGHYVVLQGQHVIVNPGENRFGSLAAIDMRLNNRLRNQAKHNLGFSCRLMGDAMCFRTEVLRQYGWPSDSLGEDREYGVYLLTQGIKIGYVPQAVSYGQAAPSWKTAATQRVRWYGGVSEIQRKFAAQLLKLFLQKRDLALLDQAIELLLPPFTFLAVLSVVIAGVQWLWPAAQPLFPLAPALLMAATWIAFPFIGLTIDKAPLSLYKALLYSPFYVAWRLWAGLRARLLGQQVRWVRTPRREEISAREK